MKEPQPLDLEIHEKVKDKMIKDKSIVLELLREAYPSRYFELIDIILNYGLREANANWKAKIQALIDSYKGMEDMNFLGADFIAELEEFE